MKLKEGRTRAPKSTDGRASSSSFSASDKEKRRSKLILIPLVRSFDLRVCLSRDGWKVDGPLRMMERLHL